MAIRVTAPKNNVTKKRFVSDLVEGQFYLRNDNIVCQKLSREAYLYNSGSLSTIMTLSFYNDGQLRESVIMLDATITTEYAI